MQSSGYLYWRRSAASLEELIDLLRTMPSSPAWRLQEGVDMMEFDHVGTDWLDGLPVGLWPQGRVFGPQAEVRWRMADESNYEVLILTETKINLCPEDWREDKVEVNAKHPLYLWGKRGSEDSYWVETRIPRPLYYPVLEDETKKESRPYVVIQAQDYSVNCIVRATRLVCVEPAD